MQLMLDSANLKDLEKAMEFYPISGVTTNPQQIQGELCLDFFGHLRSIRSLIGQERSLHVQVLGRDSLTIIGEAEKLCSLLGDDTYISIPVTEEGLTAIKILTARGFNITATTVFSTIQGILAMLCGVKYVAVFYDRMLNNDIDAPRVIRELSSLLWTNTSNTQVLAASFKNVAEITTSYACGAGCCTVRPEILSTGLSMPSIQKAVGDFRKRWDEVYAGKTILDL
ncbi:fructose-6-phosphate aldolase [Sphaerochaeta sp. PS]|uniref:fructose-6-phosphate aldolase n=1 Tax=Sphaerochaeta sp. PS TaxID=3076336 RepID=UPI0028A4396C|nr:fructose-6-phosphate aldolase [Sphaerochaeta sp. PS]MDT4762241.1 fructose-6-phosphate aldolase [Sphaerochaeta sp. PS]